MRVLHVIETLGVGGAERLLVNLLPELQRQGVSVATAVLREPYDLRGALEDEGIAVISLPPQYRWSLWSGARAVAQVASDLKCDIVHAHLFFSAIYTALARTIGLMRAKTVVTFHNLAYARGVNRPGVGLELRRALGSALYRVGMDRRTAVSAAVAAHYQRALRLADIGVVYNPVDLAGIDRLVDSPMAAPHAVGGLFVPGRLVEAKGHAFLIEALAILRDRGVVIRATFAGDGSLRAKLQRAVRIKTLDSQVDFKGMMEHAELIRCMAKADVVVMPSLHEGLPVAALEAMAVRRPIVATSVGGLPEACGADSGIVVPPADSIALANAIESLLNDPEARAKLGAAGRRRAERHFSVERIAAEYRNLYETTLAEGGPLPKPAA